MRYLCLALSFFMFSGCGLRGKLERPSTSMGEGSESKSRKSTHSLTEHLNRGHPKKS